MCKKCNGPKFRCCEVVSMFGHSLRQGVVLIGIASVVISSVTLLSSVACVIPVVLSNEQINKHSLMAVNLIFCLVASCLSVYTLTISVLLLWQARQTKANTFICSLWYVSHLSILALYCLLFIAKITVCFIRKHYATAVFAAFILILYQGVFIYFAIVVNSYVHSLNQERYL